MRITGNHRIEAPCQQVWDALRDPAVLARTLPGATSLVAIDDDTYEATMHVGVASIKGTYRGTVRLADAQPPTAYRMHVSGAGVPGTVDATVAVRLEPDGDATNLHYDADAQVGGMIGGVGQRMLSAVSRRMADEFFRAVEKELAVTPAPEASSPGIAASRVSVPVEPTAAPPESAPAAATSAAATPAAGATTSSPPATSPPATDGSTSGSPAPQPASVTPWTSAAPDGGAASRVPELVAASVAGGLLALAGVLVGRRLGRGPRR